MSGNSQLEGTRESAYLHQAK